MKGLTKLSLVGLLVLGGVACSTRAYSGPALPSDKTAVLKGHGVFITKVNSTSVDVFTGAVVIAEGKNTVEFTIDPSYFNAGEVSGKTYQLQLDAQGGVNYAITSQRGVGKVCAFVINDENGEVDFSRQAGCI